MSENNVFFDLEEVAQDELSRLRAMDYPQKAEEGQVFQGGKSAVVVPDAWLQEHKGHLPACGRGRIQIENDGPYEFKSPIYPEGIVVVSSEIKLYLPSSIVPIGTKMTNGLMIWRLVKRCFTLSSQPIVGIDGEFGPLNGIDVSCDRLPGDCMELDKEATDKMWAPLKGRGFSAPLPAHFGRLFPR